MWYLDYEFIDKYNLFIQIQNLTGGEGGIRTPVGILSQTRFPGELLKLRRMSIDKPSGSIVKCQN